MVKKKDNFVSNEEKDKIIKELLPFITITARRLSHRIFKKSHLTVDDLISIGILALLESLNRYDKERASFKTFADYRIKGAMLDAIHSQYTVSKDSLKKFYSIKQAYRELEIAKGDSPEEYEIAEKLGLTLDEYYEILEQNDASIIFSLNVESNDERRTEIINNICDEKEEPIDKSIEKKILCEKLASKIKELSEKEQLVLSLYYVDEFTMKEIAKVLEISEGRVCQILNQALIKLKLKLEK